ncbi:MAG: hypothetical protein IKY04_06390 [Lachnospiraceae bacterium]|nr:hypothetical protein [Lachnospiraceae bacterium]
MPRARTLVGRINGATGAYLGNNRRHSLTPGNRLASHNTVYRQLRRSFGMSAG